jgi:hypothetical protein
MEEYTPIERALSAVGELLAADQEEVRVVVVGGAALNLLGTVARATRDVDVIALGVGKGEAVRLVLPEELPTALSRAIATVARDLDIPVDWMNTMVASQWRTGLPPRMNEGIQWRRFGGLLVGLPSRFPLICLKLYAAADQRGPESRHYQDLVALKPGAGELSAAAEWIATQDPTIGEIVARVIAYALRELR